MNGIDEHVDGEFYDEEDRSFDEEYLSPWDIESTKDLRRQVMRNDPSLDDLTIGMSCCLLNLVKDGESIGKNTQLRKLCIVNYERTTEQTSIYAIEDFDKFYHGIAHNRSIEELSFEGTDVGGIFSILAPFFKNNKNFHSLKIDHDTDHGCRHLLVSGLAKFDSLKEFELDSYPYTYTLQESPDVFTDDKEGELVQVLTGHSGLEKLKLDYVRVGRNGFASLATFLKNPACKLDVLDLQCNEIDDEKAVVLASGLAGNNTLKTLALNTNRGMTETGWIPIFTALRSPNCILEGLGLERNRFSYNAIRHLSNFLTNSRTLRSLDLSSNYDITITGWDAVFAVLQNHDSVLTKLDLGYNRIHDEIVNSLVCALTGNNKLKELELDSNRDITVTGWEAFSSVLRNPLSALEKINLWDCTINDNSMISLVTNDKLKELVFNTNSQITLNGWAQCSRVLCNTSSIMDTFLSNHTLEFLRSEYHIFNFNDLPIDLRSLLRINRENSKSQSARIKIIKTHFSGSKINLQPFVAMELQVLPHAIAWMGRDGIDDNDEITTETNGRSLLYQFLRGIPSLFEINGGNREP
mmetsp:Transcript_38962/g.70190  ORF Transcript_38962/g.70190 Transcript_38962/m.70190 type:complete len:580 (+) Transcript_38962:354-2093(+)